MRPLPPGSIAIAWHGKPLRAYHPGLDDMSGKIFINNCRGVDPAKVGDHLTRTPTRRRFLHGLGGGAGLAVGGGVVSILQSPLFAEAQTPSTDRLIRIFTGASAG